MAKRDVTVTVNGETATRNVEDRKLLVHFLREDLGYTGVHQGCVVGKCGACTVIHEGAAKKSCMMYAPQVDGQSILTVEGLADRAVEEGVAVEAADGTPIHPLQQGFKEKHGLQCGFCTPGMLMSSYALLKESPAPDREEIENAISGNICRCTGYNSIVESIQWASEELQSAPTSATDGGQPVDDDQV